MTVATLFGELVAFLLLAPGAFAQDSGVIGVNMTFPAGYGTPLYLAPSDVAGAVPVLNWNNYVADTAWPPTQGTNDLLDSTGANTGVGLSMSGVNNGWYNGGTITSASTPDAKLLNCIFVLRSGGSDTYTFNSLPAVGNYDVYVYLSGQDNADEVVVQCQNNGVSYYQTAPGQAITNNQVLAQGNNTTPGTYPNCNYVKFSGVAPAANAISFVVNNGPSPGDNGGVAGVQLVPSSPTFFAIAPQPQTTLVPLGQNATFTAGTVAVPAVATTYQWYEISGGVTNLIAGATTSSYTTNSPTASASYFVVVGNGSTTLTSSVAVLNLYNSAYTDGTWNTSSGSWNTPGNWVGNTTASGIGATASFVNGLGGIVTLDNAAGFTVGTSIFGVSGATTVQPAWTINSGSPAGFDDG